MDRTEEKMNHKETRGKVHIQERENRQITKNIENRKNEKERKNRESRENRKK